MHPAVAGVVLGVGGNINNSLIRDYRGLDRFLGMMWLDMSCFAIYNLHNEQVVLLNYSYIASLFPKTLHWRHSLYM